MMTLKISKEFSPFPGPRYRKEGPYSGEEFREKVLVPAIETAASKREKLKIDFDGTSGYATSFLEESFGGLIRLCGYSLSYIKDNIEFASKRMPWVIAEVEKYLKKAEDHREIHE